MDLIQEKTMKTKAISVKRNYIRGKTILYAAICFQIFLMGFYYVVYFCFLEKMFILGQIAGFILF